MERVETTLKEVAKAKEGKTISIRLDPPSLGSVRIDITRTDTGLHARLLADNPQISHLLRERAHQLQTTLRKLGLDVQDVYVSVGENRGERQSMEQREQRSGSFQQVLQNNDEMVYADESSLESDSLSAEQASTMDDHWVA